MRKQVRLSGEIDDKTQEFIGIDDNLKNLLHEKMQNLHIYVGLTYDQYDGITSGTQKKYANHEEIVNTVKQITGDDAPYVIRLDLLEQYVRLMNRFLTQDVMKNLLKSSQELLQELFRTE